MNLKDHRLDSPAPGIYAESILISIRRIARAIDLHSRSLGRGFKLTVPQLVCLKQLEAAGPISPSELSRLVYLSQATITGILNRLEDRGLVKRERKNPDRRLVTVSLTDKGRQTVSSAPSPLQEVFLGRLDALAREDQENIAQILEQVVEMMQTGDMSLDPVMKPAALTSD